MRICRYDGCSDTRVAKNNTHCNRHRYKKALTGSYEGMEEWYAEKAHAKQLWHEDRLNAQGLLPGDWLSTNGYVRRDGKLLHRTIMEGIIGRGLLDSETVHHKDGNRLNNSTDNLELWSSAQPSGQRVADKVVWAEQIVELYGGIFE